MLFLAWFPAVNACVIAAIFPNAARSCCEAEHHDSEGPLDSCDQCAALENGFIPAHLAPLTLVPPVWVEQGLAWDFSQLSALTVEINVPEFYQNSPPIAEFWHLISDTTAPVRGPSFGV